MAKLSSGTRVYGSATVDTTLAAGNTTITGFANVATTLQVNSTFVANSTAVYANKIVDKDNGSFELNSDGTSYLTNLDITGYLSVSGTSDLSGVTTVYNRLTVTGTNQANLGILRVRSTSNLEGNTTITGFVNATSTGTFATTLQVGNNSGGIDATLHIKSVQGGNGRFLQFSPQANSANALAIMASSNSSGGEQWWSIGSQNDDTFKIQKGVGFGGAGVSISNTGAITSANLADAFGYKGIPQNSQTSSYTLALSDIGKHISITTGGVVIPENGSVAFPIGATIVVFNNSGSNQTISITTDTLRLAGTATTGSRTLAQYGLATLVKVTSTVWVVTGNIT